MKLGVILPGSSKAFKGTKLSRQAKIRLQEETRRPKKRRITEAHKQAISEANKAHWAKRKAKSERRKGLKRSLSALLDWLWPI